MGDEWRFLIDENLHPQIVRYLGKEGFDAEYVPDVLFIGADDDDDVLPYARKHDHVVVTNDVRDFSDRDDGEHEGIILVYDGQLTAFTIVSGILDIIEAYPNRDAMRGYEVLDDWL